MTNDKEFSRREFLVKFAMFSSVSLLVGCGSSGGQVASPAIISSPVYGPPTVPLPTIGVLYFIDTNTNKVIPLQNDQSVPVLVAFRIDFNVSVNTSKPVIVNFSDSAGNSVAVVTSWVDGGASGWSLIMTPTSRLAFGTAYALSLAGDLEDVAGGKIQLTGKANATFATVSA